MKKINLFYIEALASLLLLSSCEGKAGPNAIVDYNYYSHCKLVNKSGVEVTVVADKKGSPETLLIQDGGEYTWIVNQWIGGGPFGGYYETKVSFDQDVVVTYNNDYMPERNPGYWMNYDRVIIDEYNDSLTYTFTPEDYENALKQQ